MKTTDQNIMLKMLNVLVIDRNMNKSSMLSFLGASTKKYILFGIEVNKKLITYVGVNVLNCSLFVDI